MILTQRDIEAIKNIIYQAADIANKYYNESLTVQYKSDLSPVSNADIEINNFICSALRNLTKINVISEENNDNYLEDVHSPFWLVDPIDGTRNYIEQDPNYTINVGLIVGLQPKYGFIYKPSTCVMQYLDECGNLCIESHQNKISRFSYNNNDLIIAILNKQSTTFQQSKNFLAEYHIKSYVSFYGSSKLGHIIQGFADIYAKFDPCMEWDTAAGHALLKSIGGDIVDTNFTPLRYGKSSFKHNNFIAYNNRWIKYTEEKRYENVNQYTML